jgi:Domain of unknown function (DUF4337)
LIHASGLPLVSEDSAAGPNSFLFCNFQAVARSAIDRSSTSDVTEKRPSLTNMEEPEVPTEQLQEEIRHRVGQQGEHWTLWVALSCALLASLAAVASMSAGHYATEAMVSQIESANQWSYFQSKSIKEAQLKTKMELLEALGKPATEADKTKAAEYREEKDQIQKKAEELGKESTRYLGTHHILARSVTLFQIAIAIGAISVLTRRRPFWYVSLASGVMGLLFVVQAVLSLGAR